MIRICKCCPKSETKYSGLSLDVYRCYRQHWRNATRRYFSYSEADFEVFRPAGATRRTDGVKFGTEERTLVPSSVPNFTPIGATTRV